MTLSTIKLWPNRLARRETEGEGEGEGEREGEGEGEGEGEREKERTMLPSLLTYTVPDSQVNTSF